MSEYLIERMVRGGATKICCVISPSKSDILQHYDAAAGDVDLAYVCQAGAVGLCHAIFRALPVVPRDEPVIIGLPDTVWFPSDALVALPDDRFSFLLFPVEQPELFDAVDCDAQGWVREIKAKSQAARRHWIWGAFRMPGQTLHDLHGLWLERKRHDEYLGTLVNAWLAAGNVVWGVVGGADNVDVGTLNDYRRDAGRAVRGRVLHRRVLHRRVLRSASSAAGAGFDPRARRCRSAGAPVDAARVGRDPARRGGLRLRRDRDLR